MREKNEEQTKREAPRHVLPRFKIAGECVSIGPYGTGHINDTYLCLFQEKSGPTRYILQRINRHVFQEPEKLMTNIERVTAHVRGKIVAAGGDVTRETLNLIPAVTDRSYYRDAQGEYWRMYRFIAGAHTYDQVKNTEMVYEAGRAFGKFVSQLEDLDGGTLHCPIPDFHHLEKRVQAFVRALDKDRYNRSQAAKSEISFVQQRAADASRLLDLQRQGLARERIIHNDTKFNNVMIDDRSGRGLCVIDLDTVMPGLPLYDFGDAVRSCVSTAAEDERDLSRVGIDTRRFGEMTRGYLETVRDFLTAAEVDHFSWAALAMTFECGLRFLTDFLEGDLYFKTRREAHNLDRCRTQFKMVAEMERQKDALDKIVARYR